MSDDKAIPTRVQKCTMKSHIQIAHVNVTYLGKGRALNVFDRPEFLGKFFSRFQREGLLFVLGQLLDGGRVIP